ncbi:MAG: hypothetical protein F9K31_04470 [Dokdonella sp.]|nr:MAG: hypothetical protein F9K31_04470 [Dokdonella sp.]
MKTLALTLAALVLAGCHGFASRPRAPAPAAEPARGSAGVYDNHAQVWQARTQAAPVAVPHLRVTLSATARPEWTLWRVQLDGTQPMQALWAMHEVAAEVPMLVPHRALVAEPASGPQFDPAQWAALDACALRGGAAGTWSGDAATCTVLAPGIGPGMALLPLALTHEGEWLRLRLYADQARGADAREDLRRVQLFSGWAAVNGGGPKAAADNQDWHMDRAVRVENEGGRHRLRWRDGSATPWSLQLERIAYQDGNVPVLKLSVIEESSGQTLAYAWANPEASRIGIHLGWLQVGLERVVAAP